MKWSRNELAATAFLSGAAITLLLIVAISYLGSVLNPNF
jgi:hypothetical protein